MNLPEGFIPYAQQVPSHSRPVLAIRMSGGRSAKFEVITARYNPEYANTPWRTVDGDSVTESGACVLGWREADDWLQPTR